MILASKHETPWTDEEPQTNAENAYVCYPPVLVKRRGCATRGRSRRDQRAFDTRRPPIESRTRNWEMMTQNKFEKLPGGSLAG
jgi:hypothetical protein